MNSVTGQRLFNAYREGLLNKEGPPPQDYHPQFQVLFRQLLSNEVPLAQRLPVRKVWKASAQGLRLARANRLEEAASCLGSVQGALEQSSSSIVGHLMAISVLESAQSYLDFRESRFDQARDRLRRAMDADLALEKDQAFSLLEIRRIQSAQNLLRLELRAGSPKVAYLLGGRILGYLEDLTNDLPVHHSWRRELLAQTPRAVRLAMVTQIGNEISLALLRTEDSSAWEEFSKGISTCSGYLSGGGALHDRVQQWVRLKHAFQQQDWPHYLDLLASFLSNGRKDVASIWYSSVLDFLRFCRMVDSRVAQQIRAGILRDSRKWPSLPPSLRFYLRTEGSDVLSG